jgi:hypothetical protein
VPALADKLAMDASRIFDHLKELMKRNIVDVAGFDERYPIYRKR